jgi:hypothetical protein
MDVDFAARFEVWGSRFRFLEPIFDIEPGTFILNFSYSSDPFILFDMHKAEILHERSVVMQPETAPSDRGIERLMPAKNGNTPDIVFAPIKAAIFDETVPLPERTSFTSSYMCRCAQALAGARADFLPG